MQVGTYLIIKYHVRTYISHRMDNNRSQNMHDIVIFYVLFSGIKDLFLNLCIQTLLYITDYLFCILIL